VMPHPALPLQPLHHFLAGLLLAPPPAVPRLSRVPPAAGATPAGLLLVPTPARTLVPPAAGLPRRACPHPGRLQHWNPGLWRHGQSAQEAWARPWGQASPCPWEVLLVVACLAARLPPAGCLVTLRPRVGMPGYPSAPGGMPGYPPASGGMPGYPSAPAGCLASACLRRDAWHPPPRVGCLATACLGWDAWLPACPGWDARLPRHLVASQATLSHLLATQPRAIPFLAACQAPW